MAATAIHKIKHEAHGRVLYLTYSKSYIGHALTVLKDLPINALKTH